MHTRRLHGLKDGFVIFLLAVTVVAGAPGLVAPARAADAGTFFAAWQAVIDNHVDNPDPVKLLSSAVGGLRQTLSRAGITEPLADLSATDAAGARAEFQARFDQAVTLAQGRIDEPQFQYAAASAMTVGVGDSHTRFFTPEAYRAFLASLQGIPGYAGIGIRFVPRDGRYYIIEVFPGGPAARAGLRPFDRLLTVNGESVQGMTTADVVSRVRGPQGTTAALTVQRPGEAGPLSFSIVREPVAITPVEHALLERGVGYVRFRSFSQGSAPQMRRALEELRRQGARAVVLDLRDNTGGLIIELAQIANLLLPAGMTVYTEQTRQGRSAQVAAGGPILPPSMPLITLVNANTMSSSEALVAALQDHGRALVVGARTAGAVQRTRYVPLPGGAGVGVPVARIFSPKGADLEGTGITPDASLDMSTDDLDRGIDSQLRRAIELVLQRVGVRPSHLIQDRAAAYAQRARGSPAPVGPEGLQRLSPRLRAISLGQHCGGFARPPLSGSLHRVDAHALHLYSR